jgi:nitrite reductase/ring-hydroxylating ferredoxin subunit
MRAHEDGAPPTVVVATGDPRLLARIDRIAQEESLTLVSSEPASSPPVVAIVDLDRPEAVDTLRQWRQRWPEALLLGCLGQPDRDRWVAAQRAGCDLVVNRGALPLRLRESVAVLRDSAVHNTHGDARQRRYPLFDSADVAGRLGVVYHGEQTPVGPISVVRAKGRLCAIADRCPHAGGSLSDGTLEGSVLTCPRHGSQFDVTTGERVRGPADDDIATFRLVEEGGQVFLVLPVLA